MPNWKKVIVSGSDATLNSLFVANAVTASIFSGSHIGPLTGTASWATNAINASTASSADNFTVRGTLTAQTIVVQVITSSTDFVTGSTRFGTLASNTHQFTGSVSISGSLTVQGAISGSNITGSLLGTASYANNALSSSYAVNAGNSITASFATNANSASYALNAGNAQSASFATNAANAFIQNGNSFGTQALLGTNDAQNLAFETNGTIRMTVDSNGNVGIGTNVPTRSLDIRGAARIETASTTEFDFIGGGGNILRISCGATIPFIGTLTNAPLGFFTSATERARIDANGNFGIGTTTPSAKLDVSGSTVITGSLTVITGSNIEFQVLNTGVRIGNIISDIHTVTGSLGVSGSVTATNFTGSLFGTASWANNVITASFATNAGSASYALTASFALNAGGGGGAVSGAAYTHTQASPSTTWTVDHSLNNSYPVVTVYDFNGFVVVPLNISSSNVNRTTITFSYGATGYATAVAAGVSNIISASFATNAATAQTASFFGGSISSAVSASYASSSTSSSFATNAVTAQTASFFSGTVTSASYALNAGNTQTASFATNANSASYALNSGNTITASFATNANSASYALNAGNTQTASFAINAGSASYALNAGNTQSSSFAATASSADNFLVRGTLTAQTIVVQTITSSTDFVTGSTRFGTIASNTHQFTGSVSISGSLTVQGAISGSNITGSLLGTASFATNTLSSSYALNAGNTISSSFSTNAGSSSYALNAGNTQTASFATNANSASYALTASLATNVVGAANRILFNNATNITTGSNNLTFDGSTLSVVGSLIVSGSPSSKITAGVNGGDEGGEILLEKPQTNTTLTGSGVTIDVYQNRLRFFEQGGAARGYFIDITGGGAGVSTNLVGGGSGTPGGSNTQIQYNNAGAFGGVSTLTFDGTTLRATGSFTGSLTGALTGTASFAQTASFFGGSISTAVSASYASSSTSASFATNAQTASFALNGNSNFLHTQSIAATTWSVNHNFQTQFPVVTVYDSTNSVIIPQQISASSTSSLTILFATARTGWVAVSKGGYAATVGNTVTVTSASYAATASYAEGFNISLSQYSATSSAISGSSRIIAIPTASYNAVFVDYVVSSGSNQRAGTFIGTWNINNVQFTDNSTLDIGSTTPVTMSVAISGSRAVVQTQSPAGWTIKTTYRTI